MEYKWFKSVSVSGKLNIVRWRVPHSLASMIEGTFTKFGTSAAFDVVGKPQTWSMADVYSVSFASVVVPSISLPADIRLCESVSTFKRRLKTHLFRLT